MRCCFWAGILLIALCACDLGELPESGHQHRTLQAPSMVEEEPQTLIITAPASGEEGEALLFEASVEDARADPINPTPLIIYQWNMGDGTQIVGSSVSHRYSNEGTYTVTVSAQSGDTNLTAMTSINIVNVPPVITMPEDIVLNENTNHTFSISVTDPGRDTIEVCWNFGEQGSPDICDAQLTNIVHNYEENGDYTLTVSADDGGGAPTTSTALVRVNNRAPLIDTNPERIIGVNQTLTLEATITDTPADNVSYRWGFSGANVEILDDSVDGMVEGGQVSLNVRFSEPGNYTVTLSARDDDLGINMASIDVEVQPGAPPTASLNSELNGQPGEEGDSIAFSLASSGEFPIVAWELNFGDGSPVEGGDTGSFDGDHLNNLPTSHTYENNGIYQARLTVTDSNDAQGDALLTVVIDNVPPLVTLDEARGAEGQEIVLQPSVVEPGIIDRDNLQCIWDLGDGSDSVTNDCLSALRHTYAQDGQYTITILVQDDASLNISSAQVIIDNVPPTVALVDLEGVEGQPLDLAALIDDPGDDSLTVTWDLGDGEGLERVLVNNSDTLTDIIYPQDSGNGAFTLTVTVDDGQASATDTAQVTIRNADPEVSADDTLRSITEGDSVLLSATVVDPGVQDSLSFQWFLDGFPTTTTEAPSLLFDGEDDGTQSLRLLVDDGDDGSGEVTFVVEVNNAPPRFNFDPVIFGAEGELYTQRLTFTDPGPLDEHVLTLVSGPAGMTLTGAVLNWTPSFEQANQGAPFAVSVRVIDDDGGSDTLDWTINLNVTDDDNDTLPDTCEATCPDVLDPNRQDDPNQDFDQDGIDTFTECQQGTSPCLSNAPAAPSLLAPVEGALVGGQVTLRAQAEDPDDDPLTFTVEIEALDVMQPGVTTIDGLNAIDGLMNVPLSPEQFTPQEDVRYRWRARADDGAAAGPWSDFGEFFYSDVNDAPTQPRAISPIGADSDLRPNFVFENATDPEGDALTYTLRLIHPTEDAILISDIPQSNQATTSWRVEEPLDAGVSYLWSVRAVDDGGLAGEYSVAQTLRPGESVSANALLQFPGRHAMMDDFPVRLIASRNPLFSGEVSYIFEVSSSEDFESDSREFTSEALTPDADGLVETLFEGQEPVEDETYFWRVRAEGPDADPVSPYSETRTFVFSVSDDPPSPPVLLSPGSEELVETLSPLLVFQPAIDPERQPVSHTLEIFSDEPDGAVVVRRQIAASATADPVSVGELILEDQRQYSWRVTGADLGGQQAVSGTGTFTVRLSELPPAAPILREPTSGQGVGAEDVVTFSWLPSLDPARRALTYELEVGVPGADAASVFNLFNIEGEGSLITASTREPLPPGFYVWRVRANNGVLNGPWSDAGVFKVTSPHVTPEDDPCEASPEDCESEDLQPRYPGSLNGGCATTSGAGGAAPSGAWLLLLLGLVALRTRVSGAARSRHER